MIKTCNSIADSQAYRGALKLVEIICLPNANLDQEEQDNLQTT